MTYCTDFDLLQYEPNLATEAAMIAQELTAGSGTLDANRLAIHSALPAISSKLLVGAIAVVGGAVGGSFPIERAPAGSKPVPTLVLTMKGLTDRLPTPAQFSVRTFYPHRRVISDLLRGLRASSRNAAMPTHDDAALRRACALGTLHLIYSTLATAVHDRADLLIRAQVYQQLYRKALKNI